MITKKPAKGMPRFSRELPAVRRRMIIDAATRCLARGGISALTKDNIRKEAKVSIGLVAHHFPDKDEILAEVYHATLYEGVHDRIVQARSNRAEHHDVDPEQRLLAIIEAHFSDDYFSRGNLLVWLSLWSEIARNEKLRAKHGQLWREFRQALQVELEAVAAQRGRQIDGKLLALSFIALFDGLWLEWCLDPTAVSREEAMAGCYSLLEAQLGKLQ